MRKLGKSPHDTAKSKNYPQHIEHTRRKTDSSKGKRRHERQEDHLRYTVWI